MAAKRPNRPRAAAMVSAASRARSAEISRYRFPPFNGHGAQLAGTGHRRSLRHPKLRPEGYLTSSRTRCATSAEAPRWAAGSSLGGIGQNLPCNVLPERLGIPLAEQPPERSASRRSQEGGDNIPLKRELRLGRYPKFNLLVRDRSVGKNISHEECETGLVFGVELLEVTESGVEDPREFPVLGEGDADRRACSQACSPALGLDRCSVGTDLYSEIHKCHDGRDRCDELTDTAEILNRHIPPPNGSAFSGVRPPGHAPRNSSEVAILPCSGTAQREQVRSNGLLGGSGATRMSESEGWIAAIARGATPKGRDSVYLRAKAQCGSAVRFRG